MSVHDFDTDLADIQKMIADMITTYGADARLDYGQHNVWDDSYSFSIERPQTDEEYALYCEECGLREIDREKRELAEYARLQQKYGSK
jgi:hypothetical protein